MATLKAEVVTIDDVVKHPKADRLDLVVVKGWNVITSRVEAVVEKGETQVFSIDAGVPEVTEKEVVLIPRYKKGDKCIYIPIDSILNPKLEEFLFPEGSKIKLRKSRIRTEKIRGCYSQGMVLDFSPELLNLYPKLRTANVGDDVTSVLGITKFEPPVKEIPKQMKGKIKPQANPDFKPYTNMEHFKNHPDVFKDDEEVYITEKLHGTSFRAAKLETHANTLWKKILKFFGQLPKYEFCFGSRKVQYQEKLLYRGFYKENVYARIAGELQLEHLLKPGEALYGEIVGPGIQAGYTYGVPEGQLKFFAYDVMVDGKFLSPNEFLSWCYYRHIPHVPVLDSYGKAIRDEDLFSEYGRDIRFHKFSPELVFTLGKGDSTVGKQKIREGVVIKPKEEANDPTVGRKMLKYVSDEYYFKEGQKEDSTDFH